MKKVKYFLPAVLLMIIIFIFSGQNGEQSSGLSTQIVLWLQNNFHISIPEIIIRKGAHMSEYALLAGTLLYGFHKSDFPIQRTYLFSILFSFLYACSDELHQLFIGGRAGQFTDVLIDTSGAIIMVFICYYLIRIKRRG